MATRTKGPYRVLDEVFKTQEELTLRIRGILHGNHGKELQGRDHDFALALLNGHKEAATKVGVGIRKLSVEKNREGTWSFYLTRVDGSRDDFSYKSCFAGVSLGGKSTQ